MRIPLFGSVVVLLSLLYSVIGMGVFSSDNDGISQQRNYSLEIVHTESYLRHEIYLAHTVIQSEESSGARPRQYRKLGDMTPDNEANNTQSPQMETQLSTLELVQEIIVDHRSVMASAINRDKRTASITV